MNEEEEDDIPAGIKVLLELNIDKVVKKCEELDKFILIAIDKTTGDIEEVSQGNSVYEIVTKIIPTLKRKGTMFCYGKQGLAAMFMVVEQKELERELVKSSATNYVNKFQN